MEIRPVHFYSQAAGSKKRAVLLFLPILIFLITLACLVYLGPKKPTVLGTAIKNQLENLK